MYKTGTVVRDCGGDDWRLEEDGLYHVLPHDELVARSYAVLDDHFGPLSLVSGPNEDVINQPSHYTSHPSGIECIQVTEHMNFNRGNAVKYIWRADDKGDPIENLQKARWYVDREISRLENRTS